MPDVHEPVDVVRLRDLYQRGGLEKTAFDHFSEREREFGETSVESLVGTIRRTVPGVTRSGVVGFFQTLQLTGCGRFIVGRRFNKSRFAWSVDNRLVGRAARGEEDAAAKLKEGTGETTKQAADADPAVAQAKAQAEEVLEHRYRLRADYEVVVKFPMDLRAIEAERFATFVRSLPFVAQES